TGIRGRRTKTGQHRTIDVLAAGYVVAPPSRHRNGNSYRWLGLWPDGALPSAPEWAVNLLTERPERGDQLVKLPADLPKVEVEQLPVSAKVRQLIQGGAQDEDYPSRSEEVFAVTMAMVE